MYTSPILKESIILFFNQGSKMKTKLKNLNTTMISNLKVEESKAKRLGLKVTFSCNNINNAIDFINQVNKLVEENSEEKFFDVSDIRLTSVSGKIFVDMWI